MIKRLSTKQSLGGLFAVVIIIVVVIGLMIIKTNEVRQAVGGTTNNATSNPIALDNSSGNSDTLAQWKADPKYQNPLTGISYAELFRNSDKYKGQFVHYTGEAVQVLGDSGNWNLRVNITPKGTAPYTYWEDTVFVFSYSPDRVIEKDIIDFTAQANGVTTYKSTLGGDITIPSLTIYEQKVIGRAD